MGKKIISILITLFGVGLACYPWISNWVFQHAADNKVTVYQNTIKNESKERQQEMLKEAHEYNANLSQGQVTLTDPFDENQVKENENLQYSSVLNVDGEGMMAYIEIPCINVSLPVFHGTDNVTLENGVGHLEGSSLPVGGESTHAVLTGHTGLNKAKLFTDLTEVKEKDLFFIHVCGETLAYEVCEISVVRPEEISSLLIRDGEDLVTLVTCTPYGVNTHRLFVTGRRTEYTEELHNSAKIKKPDSMWMRTYRKALMIGLVIALLLIGFIRLLQRRNKNDKNN